MNGMLIDYNDISKSELETIPKSSIFQLSLKYDPLSITKPSETILTDISKVKT